MISFTTNVAYNIKNIIEVNRSIEVLSNINDRIQISTINYNIIDKLKRNDIKFDNNTSIKYDDVLHLSGSWVNLNLNDYNLKYKTQFYFIELLQEKHTHSE